jgi:monoamine oxidase
MEGERAADAALTAQALKGLGLDPRRPEDDSEA